MTNLEVLYLIDSVKLSVEEHNLLVKSIKENNLDSLFKMNKKDFQSDINRLFEGLYTMEKGYIIKSNENN